VTAPALLMLGAGGHARACIEVVEQDGRFTIGGLLGAPTEVGTSVLGYPVLGADQDVATLAGGYMDALVTVGQIKTATVRVRLFETILRLGLNAPTIVSPRAYVSRHASLGRGTIVMHGAVVNAGAVIGENCIVNSLSLVEHDVVVGDHCHVATGALINGGVRMGSGTFIGSGATVRQELAIGARCVVGMGQRVLADLADDSQLPRAGSA
jgi:sugar O-acyltransferase (sialic acid O-acetyltransferase NeuD family)